MKYLGILGGIVLLVFMVAIIVQYGIGAFVAVEQSNNMTNSSYANQWNTTINLSMLAISLLQFSPPLLAISALVITLIVLGGVLATRSGSARRKRRNYF
jgi:phosphatidylglycerophosphate synthase